MPPICTVGGVDVSAYLKAPLNVRPGGDGQVGGATLVFDQQAGGLDLRTMMDVRVWIPHTGSSGIASKGRLFGGLVMTRDTTNVGTTKQWVLKCWDYNKILKSSVRRAAPVYAVTLSADTLDDQLVQLFGILQGSADIQIQVECALTTAMPAVTYPGGMSFEWYLQQLLIKAYELEPSEIPGYYMGTNVTSGIGDTFGNPVLWVYDAALTPSPAFVFSDTPTGGEKSVYPDFRRVTDATALTQLQQAWWSGVVLSASDDTSQAAYPNPYIDQMGDGTGYWADEVLEDTHSATEDEAQAALDRLVAVKGNPRDTFVWVTEERLLPGEYIELKWDLEGIPAGTSMRVAQVSSGWEEPDKVISQLTLNTRRLGLFDDGTGGYFAAPIEGSVAPLPITNLDSSTAYDPVAGQSWVHLTWDQSPSPNARRNKIYIMQAGTVIQEVILDGLYTEYSYLTPPSTAYQATVSALAQGGQESQPFLPPTSGTSAPPFTDRPLNPSFEEADLADATLPRYWVRDNVGNATAVRDDTEHSAGSWSALLTHGTSDVADEAGIKQKFHISGGKGEEWVFGVHALGENGKEILRLQLVVVDESDTPIASTSREVPVTTDWRWYPLSIVIETNFAHSVYATAFEADSTTSAKKIWIDAVDWNPAGSQIRGGVLTPEQAYTVANTTDQISLIDRARMAAGWRNLGLLTDDAFREASIQWWDGDYYVYSTQEYEVDNTRVHVASTLEGIVGATPTDDLAPVKYPSVVIDPQTGITHLWGSTAGITEHYTALSPTGPFTLSDTVDTADDIFDAGFAKHPTNGYWYGIGFENEPPGPNTALRLVRASAPEGPWTDMGNVFADVGFPPFGKNGRPDPNLAFVGGRAYLLVTLRPNTALGVAYYPSIIELNLDTGRVMGAPYALLDERDEWMIGDGTLLAQGISDLHFLRVPGEPDRLFAFANDGIITGDWGWGCLDLPKTVVPTDGRTHDDLVRVDMQTGVDKATGIRAVTRTGATWAREGLVIDTADGGAHGYLSTQYIQDFTAYVVFSSEGAQGDPAEVFAIKGADYGTFPTIQIDIESGDIRGVLQASDGTTSVLASGITVVSGQRYAVLLRRAGEVVTMWVDGVEVASDTNDAVIDDMEVWSLGNLISLTQPELFPFVGTIYEAWAVGHSVPQAEAKRFAAASTEPHYTQGVEVNRAGQIQLRRDAIDSADRRNYALVNEVETAGDLHIMQSTTNTGSPTTQSVMKFNKERDVRIYSALYVPEMAAPSSPPSGIGALYEKTDGKLYFKNDAGTEYDLTQVGTGTVTGSGTTGNVAIWSSSSALTGTGDAEFVGDVYFNSKGVYAKDDAMHGMIYDGTLDGPKVMGWAGVELGTNNGGYSGKLKVTTAGTIIGGGTAIAQYLSATATLDFGNTNAQTSTDLTITVTGAAVGDTVMLGVPNGSVNANSCFTGWVSATNTVTVRFNNYSAGAINPASGTFRASVLKH